MNIEVINIFYYKRILQIYYNNNLHNKIQELEEYNCEPFRRLWYNLILVNISPYIGIKLKR